MSIETIIFFRYGLASLVLLLTTTWMRLHCRIKKSDLMWVFLIGVIVYIMSPLLALRGVQLSQALDISILVSLEPLATAVLAYFLLKETLTRQQKMAIFIAVPGVMLLSGVHQTQVGAMTSGRIFGNLLFVASLFCEGSHTAIGKKLSGRYHPMVLSAYSFFIGFVLFSIFNATSLMQSVTQPYSMQVWVGVIYLGVICSALGYTVWFYLLKRLRANTIALSLYFQAIIGALIGHFILGEQMHGLSWLGAGLILLAVSMGFYHGGKR